MASGTVAKSIISVIGLAVAMASLTTMSGAATATDARTRAGAGTQAEGQTDAQADEGCGGEGLMVQMKINGTSRLANPNIDGDLTVGPGLFDGVVCGNVTEEGRIEGDLVLPPADGYFVAFRFMPSTNTTEFIQQGKATGTVRNLDMGAMTADVDMTVRLFVLVRDVKQDGVPLNVGKRCRTTRPSAIRIKGKVNLAPGAETEVKSRYAISPFTGCGATEELDPLITGLVSGPDNLQITRMTSCGVGAECPPDGEG